MAAYPEKELIADFIKGDPKAFKEIYDVYFNRMFVFAVKLIEAKDESEDIVLDSFTKLFQMHQRFESLPNIVAFLYVTVRNTCLNHLRHTQLMESKKKEWAKTHLETDTWLEINQVEGEMLKAIYKAVEELPKGSRSVIKLYLEGLSTLEIADRLDISVPTVRSQKRHAIQLLKAALRSRRLIILFFFLLYLQSCRQRPFPGAVTHSKSYVLSF